MSKFMSSQVLKRLLIQKTIVKNVSCEEYKAKNLALYTSGIPANYFCLILEGCVEVEIGNDGLKFESRAYSYFGAQALNYARQSPELEYRPDFTACPITDCLIITVTQGQYMTARRASMFDGGKKSAASIFGGGGGGPGGGAAGGASGGPVAGDTRVASGGIVAGGASGEAVAGGTRVASGGVVAGGASGEAVAGVTSGGIVAGGEAVAGGGAMVAGERPRLEGIHDAGAGSKNDAFSSERAKEAGTQDGGTSRKKGFPHLSLFRSKRPEPTKHATPGMLHDKKSLIPTNGSSSGSEPSSPVQVRFQLDNEGEGESTGGIPITMHPMTQNNHPTRPPTRPGIVQPGNQSTTL